jgi:hypothetical protein
VKAGQELEISANFAALSSASAVQNALEIFDDNKQSISKITQSTAATLNQKILANSGKTLHTYFVKLANEGEDSLSGEVSFTLHDCFDAGSNTDAPANFSKALVLTPGYYTGYLSQLDVEDFYQIDAAPGPFSLKLTPNNPDITLVLKVYDSDYQQQESKIAESAGASLLLEEKLKEAGKIFFSVGCDNFCENNLSASAYSIDLKFAASAPEKKESSVSKTNPNSPTLLKIHNEIYPILEDVFDKKIVFQEQQGISALIYRTERTIAEFDYRTLREALESSGYKFLHETDTTAFTVKKGSNELTFNLRVGDRENPLITVEVKKVINWKIWGYLGVTGVCILVIIILFTRRKNIKQPKEKSSSDEIL